MIQRPPEEALRSFPRPLGNMAVGVVSEIGSEVTRFRVGDRVFGHFPIRETQTVAETGGRSAAGGSHRRRRRSASIRW